MCRCKQISNLLWNLHKGAVLMRKLRPSSSATWLKLFSFMPESKAEAIRCASIRVLKQQRKVLGTNWAKASMSKEQDHEYE